jgi:hypothetical protein
MVVVVENAGDLDNAYAAKEEVHSCKAVVPLARDPTAKYAARKKTRGDGGTYRMFLGLMIKHHRVQIAPVAVRAAFCVRESFSAGRAKSATPARTRHHCHSLVLFLLYPV